MTRFLATVFAAVLALLAGARSATALAQVWPAKPVTVIIGYSAGGPVDILARTLADPVSKRLGQPLIVTYKPGAGERIATEFLHQQLADGYNIQIVVVAFATNPILYTNLPYDPAKDFIPVVQLTESSPILSVKAESPIRNFADFVALAKAKPGEATFGSPGNATNNHLTMELLGSLAGVNFTHVPYKGDAATPPEVLGGRIAASMNALPSVVSLIQAGRLRGIGISSRQRNPRLPDVPTFVEQGYPDAVSATWFGLIVRSGTPPEIVGRLNSEFNAALALPQVRETLAKVGMTTVGGTPEQFATLIRNDTARWGHIIRERGVRIE
ncbi:MAG: tripartite tricarboxylate transporter substrate binding protein [Burkholderiales bacterium]|nr:tripartite tricarboxylate transporter substrate binding protein [Burkholderiales bacterium]